MRLQKAMAQAGVASRRGSEALIREGRVTVNGSIVTEQGVLVNPSVDRIAVDGKPIDRPEPLTYYAVFKPVGYLSSAGDPHGGALVVDLVPAVPRVFPVGRLDLDSEGLMLLTNDGQLAQRLTHPRYEQEKEYRVLIEGELSAAQRATLARGVSLPDKLRPARLQVEQLPAGWRWRGEPVPPGCQWIGITLREGHKREIRVALDMLGIAVRRLVRLRIASLRLGTLESGQCRPLTAAEIAALRAAVGLANITEQDTRG
ncbi:MAG: rRNA pseudouridine synthase [Chloroflexi bacterium]|nr:rRNA pseudouridine synthase [Chloroflexota bacterium]